MANGCVAIPFRVGWGFPQALRRGRGSPVGGEVAIPFRVGWGFPRVGALGDPGRGGGRNPFQGGMGISTHMVKAEAEDVLFRVRVAIPFRVGWGFPPKELHGFWTTLLTVAIPFRVGWGFPLQRLLKGQAGRKTLSQSLSGWDGDFHLVLPPQEW